MATAQDTLYISKSGSIINKLAVNDIDSVVFHNSTGLTTRHGLYVNEINNIKTYYEINSIRSLSFPSGDLLVNGFNLGGEYDISNIYYLNFKEIPTDVSLKVLQEPGNFNLFPNPVSDELQISYQITKPMFLYIAVIDLQGKVWYQQCERSQLGINKTTISVSQLHPGVYLCRFQSGSKSESFKFVKK
jgi:hypothetical protein